MVSSSNIPLVSIVTVVFNGEKYLENTILSVIGQSYKKVEYIIIDGGSTDGTIDIIKKYEDKIAFWISERDRGISDAFNKGIQKCTGDIIGIINADDWYEPGAFEAIAKSFDKGDVLHGKLQYWEGDKKGFIFEANQNFLPREMTINHMTVFVKPSVYERYGFFKEYYKYAMDYELVLRFYMNKVPFFYIPKVLSNMRLGGVSDVHSKKGVKETLQAKLENGVDKNKALSFYYFHLLRSVLSKMLRKYGFNGIVKNYRKLFSTQKKSV